MRVLPHLERLGRWSLERSGFASRTVETSVGAVHVYDAPGRGRLPPIVILHGVGSNAVPYARILRRLRRACVRVLAPETPGHGRSAVPADGELTPQTVFAGISEALDQLLSEPAVVFGNSLGGGLALRYGIERPQRVRGLVLSSPAGAPFAPDELPRFLSTFRLSSRAEARAFLDHLYDRTPWYAALLADDLSANFENPALEHFFASVGPDDFATPEQLAALTMPVLLLWGRADTLMPAHHLEFFREHLPAHAVIEEPAGYGHSPYLEHPAQLAERILEFARALSSRP